jgi:hypothetical protein
MGGEVFTFRTHASRNPDISSHMIECKPTTDKCMLYSYLAQEFVLLTTTSTSATAADVSSKIQF